MIETRRDHRIAILSIDMPGRAVNVLTPELAKELGAAFDAAVADEGVDGIVVTSRKPSFVAGADLAQMAAFASSAIKPSAAMAMIALYGDLFRRIETCGKPVVAAAPGTALGGGLELMLACHHRIVADVPGARFGLPEVKLGLLPGAGGTQRLARLIGIAASLPWLTQGEEISAAAMLTAGIAHALVPADALLSAACAALREGRVDPVAAWDKRGFRLPGGDVYAPANAAVLAAANGNLHVATRGNYPAPLAILRCLYEGTSLPIDKALRLEQKYFVALVRGRVAQNMIRTLFFARQAADKLSRRPAVVSTSRVNRLGVLGAGLMGAGIAQVSALAGIDVVLVDQDQAIAERARDGIAKALEADSKKGRLSAAARDAALQRITTAVGSQAFAGCDLVIEAVLENLDVKRQVISAVEAHVGESTLIASNTSALPIDDMAGACARAENFIGLHFFSPVPRMALVEVIVGTATSAQTLARSLDYVRQIRKTPIVVNDGCGFYTTRCVDAYVREGIRLLADGVDPALIENAGIALGMPLGPLALGDEVGLDVVHHTSHFFRSREQGAWADDRHHHVNAVLNGLMAIGRRGRKTRMGFYAYPEGPSRHLDRDSISAHAMPSDVQPPLHDIRERLLYAQLIEAARCWVDGVIDDPAEADLGAILGWAFPSYLGGPLSAIDDIGLRDFIDRCDALTKKLGARFQAPGALREAAAGSFRFHGL
jgi:3-hydroxyacyl-CoA dehydrogenase/enoyl-CoA hydratase/3-hydroxybutyryl-CoA epimerase